MLTIILSALLSLSAAYATYHFTDSILASALVFIALLLGTNFLIGRIFLKKLTSMMAQVEKNIKSEKYDLAIEKLKEINKYSKWQIMLSSTINSQIGMIYYARKKFTEAIPYLEQSNFRNWNASCMLASYFYKNKEYDKAYQILDKTISTNKKESFPYSLYAYFLSEQHKTDKAIAILNQGVEKNPSDEKLLTELQAIKNNKKIKIQNYGPLWQQLHLGKAPEGVKQYQSFIANQKIRRR